ncbi:YqgE/AlgH family protein [Pedobacter steynii]
MLSRLEPSVGKLLISEPFLMDPNFKRSVVLITEHENEGTIGFILNQRSALVLSDLIPELEKCRLSRIYWRTSRYRYCSFFASLL